MTRIREEEEDCYRAREVALSFMYIFIRSDRAARKKKGHVNRSYLLTYLPGGDIILQSFS